MQPLNLKTGSNREFEPQAESLSIQAAGLVESSKGPGVKQTQVQSCLCHRLPGGTWAGHSASLSLSSEGCWKTL